MKPFINKLSGKPVSYLFAPFWLFHKKRRHVTIPVLFAIVLSGCFQHYFKTNSQGSVDAAKVQQLISANKYFILHFQNRIVALNNIVIDGDRLTAIPTDVSPEHSHQLFPENKEVTPSTVNNKRSHRMKKADKVAVLMEVHLYTKELFDQKNTINLPLSSFFRTDVYEFDPNATNTNHIFSWIGVAAATASIVGLIAFAIACNCPQVYVNNNGQYEFKSGVYSGAVYSSLERTDYLPLNGIQPVNANYEVQIHNAKDEEQFINQVQVLKVVHDKNQNVLVDRRGKAVTYQKPIAPKAAAYNGTTDVLEQIKYTDNQFYSFESGAGPDNLSEVTLQFERPAGVTKGKLLIHAGNSAWSGYLYKEFATLFGTGYEKWRKQQEENPSDAALQWQTDQGLPIKVYLATSNGWKYVDHFALTGNTAKRDMIMEIDISNAAPGDVKIRLETVHRFWDLDQAGMDFSADAPVKTTLLDPAVVINNSGRSLAAELKEPDKQYAQLTGNDFLQLEFPATSNEDGLSESLFLVSRGYYHSLQKYTGRPNITALLKFKEKSAFDKFSREKIIEIEKVFANAVVK